jgi:hypothetical protein
MEWRAGIFAWARQLAHRGSCLLLKSNECDAGTVVAVFKEQLA